MMRFITIVCSVLLFTSCQKREGYSYQIPERKADGWEVASLEDSGIDSLLINELVFDIQSDRFKHIDALLIVKDGKLVLDEYFNGYNPNKTHKIWSCTKSFSSALIGLAIDQAKIGSVDESIRGYLGTYASKLRPEQYEITIGDVLGMRTGLEWDGDLTASGRKLPYASDMIAYTLALAQKYEPGVKFQYSSANSMLLAPIIYNATGQHADEYAKETLFAKLGIENYEWNKQSEFWTKTAADEIPAVRPDIDYVSDYIPFTNTATGLWMLPRDMAKLGQLYLDKGKWKDKQIISAFWVEESIREQLQNSNYGLHWKRMNIANYATFYASGFGLQRIFIIPKLNIVLVFTQSWYQDQSEGNEQMMKILNEYIMKSLKNG